MRTRTTPFALLIALLAGLLFAPAVHAQPKGHAKITKVAVDRTAYHAGDKGIAAVVLEVDDGFHAQSHEPLTDTAYKFMATATKNDAVTFGDAVFPPGQIEEYKELGKLSVYAGTITVFFPFTVKADAKPAGLTLGGALNYQICDDKVCYQPEKPKWSIETKVVAATEETKPNEADSEIFKNAPAAARTSAEPPPALPGAVNPPTTAAVAAKPVAPSAGSAPPVSTQAEGANWGIFTALGFAFVAGIMFNIVPCVLPVLPIKVLGFAEVAQHDRAKTLLLSGLFSLGIISVFAVLALFIIVLKKFSWGEQFSNPWFAWGIVALLLVLSLWLFGVLNVNLPPAAYAFTPRHDTLAGNYLWGILTAVLSTPCTGPLLPPVLLWAASQPQVIGVAGMMMVGVGMAFPYLVLSAMPQVARKFPRVGPWSELFKQILGFVLLAFTVFFATGRLTHGAEAWWAIVPIALTAGLYMMARTVQLSKDARPVAIASFVAVAMVTVTSLVAVRFTDFSFGGNSANSVTWTPYSDDALESARKANKLVLVKFTAAWCLNCKLVEANVYHDSDTITSLRKHDVVTLKADLTEDNAPGWPRLHAIAGETAGIPLTAIYAPGYEKPLTITSVYTTGRLVSTLDQLDAPKATASAR